MSSCIWPSVAEERDALLSFLLQRYLGDPAWKVQFPQGVTALSEIDLSSIDVPKLLQKLSVRTPPLVIDLSAVRVLPKEGEIFRAGWRDFGRNLNSGNLPLRVVPPAPPAPPSATVEVVTLKECLRTTEAPVNSATDIPPDIELIEEELQPADSRDNHIPEPFVVTPNAVVPTELLGLLDLDGKHIGLHIYDQLLVASSLFLRSNIPDPNVISELLDIVRPALGVSSQQHADALDGLSLRELKPYLIKTCKANAVGKAKIPDGLQNSLKSIESSISYLLMLRNQKSGDSGEVFSRVNRFLTIPVVREAAGRGEKQFPLCVRALIFSGLLCPLYHSEASVACDEEDIAQVMNWGATTFGISAAATKLCKVHGALIRHQILAAEGEAPTMPLLEALNAALEEFPEDERLSAEERQYKWYLLQRIFSLVLPHLVEYEENTDPDLFVAHCTTFVEAAQSSSISFLSRCLCKDVDVSGAKDTQQITMFLISHMLCAPLYRELQSCKDQLTKAVPLSELLKLITNLYDSVRPFGILWSRVIPNSGGLIAVGLIRMYGAALWVHWSDWTAANQPKRTIELKDVSDKKAGLIGADLLPEGFQETLETIFLLVSTLLKPYMNDPLVLSNCYAAVEDFEWIKPLVYRQVDAMEHEMQTLVDSMVNKVPWNSGKIGDGPHTSSLDIFAMFYQMVQPLPTYFVPKSVEVMETFIRKSLKQLETYMLRVIGPLRLSAKLPQMETELRPQKLSGYLKTRGLCLQKMAHCRGLFSLSLGEILLRLNTMIAIRENLYRYFERMYEKTGDGSAPLTGAELLDTRELQRNYRTIVDSHINDIIEILSIRILSKEIGGTLTEKLYQFDLKYYKDNKGNKKLLAEDPYGHMRFLNNFTVAPALQQLDQKLLGILPSITSVLIRERLVTSIFLYFLVIYFDVVVDGGDRFFQPKQAEELFNDLCYTENFFLSALTEPSKKAVDESPIPMFLTSLKCVVSLTMARESKELIFGSEMNPAFDTMPEHSATTPFTQWIVTRILRHRKDPVAKQWVEDHPVV